MQGIVVYNVCIFWLILVHSSMPFSKKVIKILLDAWVNLFKGFKLR